MYYWKQKENKKKAKTKKTGLNLESDMKKNSDTNADNGGGCC